MSLQAYVGALGRVSDPYSDKTSLEFQFRVRRFARIRGLIDSVLERQERCEIVDLGGTEKYWSVAGSYLDDQHGRIFVTLVNTEKQTVAKPRQFRSLVRSATDPDLFTGRSFDFAHSNSVIEHVGSRSQMRAFADNMRRLAPLYYCQTPNYWFPYEPHFRTPGFQYLPVAIRKALLRRYSLGFFDRLTSEAEAADVVKHHDLIAKLQMRAFFPDAAITFETVFGLRKSILAVRDGR